MKESWKEEMRNKLEGHRKAPPSGLWEGISEQLGLAPETVVRPSSRRYWAWAAAATILLLVGWFTLHQPNTTEPPLTAVTSPRPGNEKATQETENAKPADDADRNEEAWEDVPNNKHGESMATEKNMAFGKTVKRGKNSETVQTVEAKENNEPTSPVVEQLTEPTSPMVEQLAEATPHAEDAEASTPPASPSSSDSPKTKPQDSPRTQPTKPYMPPSTPSSHRGKWSIGLNASDGLLAVSSPNRGEDVTVYLVATNKANFYSLDANNPFIETSESKQVEKHHPPMRIGASVQYKLGERLSLLSGISYTYLRTEFSVTRSMFTSSSDQHLHYLGIPLGLSWKLWSTNHFQLYLSGSAKVDKCINEQPWQFSVEGAAGAEYALSPHFGLYLEPSIGYYFDDGTSFEHYYKEHPCAPSIEFGLRLHLKE